MNINTIKDIFLTMLEISITATYVAGIIILVRSLLFKKVPKSFSYILWSVLLFRLISPFSISSSFSFFNIMDSPVQKATGGFKYIPRNIEVMTNSQMGPETNVIRDSINTSLPKAIDTANYSPLELILFIVAIIWFIGVIGFVLHSVISYRKLTANLGTALIYKSPIIDKIKLKLKMKRNIKVYRCDKIETPFVCGIVTPKVYIPTYVKEEELTYILMHEFIHIKRFDYLIKPFSYLLLILHWFNPIMWISFKLMTKDMEMSCDEGVMRNLGSDIKQDYSNSLLSLAVNNQKIFYSSPLAFGESNVKSRIKNILRFKKPSHLIIVILFLLIGLVSIVLVTNPKEKEEFKKEKSEDTISSSIDTGEDIKGEQSLEDFDYNLAKKIVDKYNYNSYIIYSKKTEKAQLLLYNIRKNTDNLWALMVTIDGNLKVKKEEKIALPKELEGFNFSFKKGDYSKDKYLLGIRYVINKEKGKIYSDLISIPRNQLNSMDILQSYKLGEGAQSTIPTIIDFSIELIGDYIVYQDRDSYWKVQDLRSKQVYSSNENNGNFDIVKPYYKDAGRYIYILKYTANNSILAFDTYIEEFVLLENVDVDDIEENDERSIESNVDIKSDSISYTNETYKFTIDLPKEWENKYGVKEGDDFVTFFYSQYRYGDGSYQDFFTIAIMTEKQYQKEVNNPPMTGQLLAKKDGNVYVLYTPLDVGIDDEAKLKEYSDLFLTHSENKKIFKLIK